MTWELAIVAILTATIHFVATLALSVRIVGVRTGLLALSFTLFNVMVLVSRTANSIQAPLLTKHAETVLTSGAPSPIPFRILLATGLIGSLAGALSIPTFQRVFSRIVHHYAVLRSWPRLLAYAVKNARLRQASRMVRRPRARHLRTLSHRSTVSWPLLLANSIAVGLLSVGVLSAILAGVLAPELRATCLTLSAVVNGVATLLLFVFVDPALSLASEEALSGVTSMAHFRRGVVQLAVSRVAGVALAQVLLVPGALVIVAIAHWL